MRVILTGLMALFMLFPLMGQMANTKKAFAEVKRSKIILGLSGNEAVDNTLRTAVDSFFRFARVVEELPYKDALAKAHKDDRMMVLYLDQLRSETTLASNSLNGSGALVTSWIPGPASRSAVLTISAGKNLKKNMMAYVALPLGDDDELPAAAVHFGVATLEDMARTINRAPKKPAQYYKETIEKRGRRLKTKTLYVLDQVFEKKYSAEEFIDTYGFEVKVVGLARWSEVILNQEEGAAYAIVSPVPLGGRHVYVHYLVDASSGQTMGAAYPAVALSLGPVNLSKGNSFTMNKKVAKLYHEAAAGK
ncbi:hypothetical protein LEM8419_02398 [Neolewinella maritima]|uniref:Uncharacterized protein n=1 Tax=Neolewinella maritima TaxID=1383882 RepID=A0ABN8FAC0_9BACT|nr:hypothetical protein [Neolewinella maritima]CAH1001495.1 hypothetical protein LEM8419_02398 [Neolewinella maritima]